MKKTLNLGQHFTVNRMGYGGMRLTGEGTWGLPADCEEAIQVLKRTVELGINFIDTADAYGPNVNEELIAEALYPYPSDLVIGTKGGYVRSGPGKWAKNGKPEHLRAALEGSLKRLKKESIQLYQLHRIDPEVPREESFKVLQKAQEEGLIQLLGLSEVSIDDIKAAQGFFEVVSVQNRYSIGVRNWEPELQYCKENGIAFIPWYPMNANNVDTMKQIEGIAQKHKASPQQIALAWLLQHAENILLIPGTSKVAHLEENVVAANIVLDAEDVKTLDAIEA
ncbi:MAG: aldo/keto reductase [Chitinophagaceae bacterium]